MSIQTQFNNQAISMLPKVLKVIKEIEDKQIRDNLVFLFLNKINNSSICLDNMSQKQLESFENNLLEILEYKLNNN